MRAWRDRYSQVTTGKVLPLCWCGQLISMYREKWKRFSIEKRRENKREEDVDKR